MGALRKALDDVGGNIDIVDTYTKLIVEHADTKKIVALLEKVLEKPLSLNIQLLVDVGASPLQIVSRARKINELVHEPEFIEDLMKQMQSISNENSGVTAYNEIAALAMPRLMELVEELRTARSHLSDKI